MKNLLSVVLLAGVLVSSSFAETAPSVPVQTTRFSVDVDYSTVSMEKVNTELDKGSNVTKFSSGIAAMAEFDVALAPILNVGVRGGYLYCMPASTTLDYIIGTTKETVNASLIPIEVGASVNLELPSLPISASAGIYGGYGLANASFRTEDNLTGQDYTQLFNGQSFTGELLGTVTLKVSSNVSVNINGGYRMAVIPKMTQNEDVNTTVLGITIPHGKKGDVLKDSSNDNLVFDYSGLNLGVGISMGF
jgi:hypothetical protein